MYENAGTIIQKYKEDDKGKFEWEDYERFALGSSGTKLRDLNRSNSRHI